MFRINTTKKNNRPDKAVAYGNDDNRRPLKNSAFHSSVPLPRIQKALKYVVIVHGVKKCAAK
jgi:hypothetical protein